MFSLRDLHFALCSFELDVLRAQRIIGFFIFITHKSTRSEDPITWFNFGFSCHNFGEVAVIQYMFILYGVAMLDDMPCLPTWPPHIKLSLISENIEIFELQLLRQNYD